MPHGAILGPLISIISVNDNINHHNIQYPMYADDLEFISVENGPEDHHKIQNTN